MPLKVAGAQVNLTVGDLDGNEVIIADAMKRASDAGADVLLLPELAIPGYPPEDLVLRRDFVNANIETLRRLARLSGDSTTVVGFLDFASGPGANAVDAESRGVANAAAILADGEIKGVYHKIHLPNYGVFDEDRYFVVGADPDRVWEVAGVPVGVSICEDIWLDDGPPSQQARNGAEVLLNINASPFHRGKVAEREEMLAARARAGDAAVVYLNLIGGQDELVFDGASVVIAPDGTILHRSPQFEEDFFILDVPVAGERVEPAEPARLLEPIEEVHRALTTGLADYCAKNGFDSVVIQISGGIDSAVTAAIAVDALGPQSVWGIGLPSRYSSQHSIDDARSLAENLGIRFDLIEIEGIYPAYLDALASVFSGTEFGVAEENLQARTRGNVAMAISNKFGPMVLATGNKSEMSVGYATLYGDMVGGYSVLKDVFKGVVYELARWLNKGEELIPQNTIDKPPSAELRPDQRDSDSLPPYEILDAILERYIERDMGVEEIVADGYPPDVVATVCRMVDRSEYKRRQAAPGVKITTKAFGKDRRLPITNHYRPRLP
jgi:NAD+ synthase (glutamine-hydrolysing)